VACRGRIAALLILLPGLVVGQQPFRELLPMEGYDGMSALPPDARVPGELVVGRLMVLIGFNNDTPDSWQWADDPRYPAEAANLGLRIGVNIATYMMTH
jgi:hypothetical protein